MHYFQILDTHTHTFSCLIFDVCPTCLSAQWGDLSHNDRLLWRALLPGLSVCHGLALSEMYVPLIELFHSNCFHLLVHKHFKSSSSPLNHNPMPPLPIFPRIMRPSCLLPKSPLPFSPGSYFFTWHFSVTHYYCNDAGKVVLAIVSALGLSPLQFLKLMSFKGIV